MKSLVFFVRVALLAVLTAVAGCQKESTPADVFASIANFLSSEGWVNDGTWGRQVSVTDNFDYSLAGLDKAKFKPLSFWQAQGVRRYDGRDLPDVAINASFIMPDGEKGRLYLVYQNFHTLMKWNRSSYFGVSVSQPWTVRDVAICDNHKKSFTKFIRYLKSQKIIRKKHP